MGAKTMQALRNIVHIILVLAIVAGGGPLYHPTDVNRDERTDLADAILQVRALTAAKGDPQAFREHLTDLLATLKVVSGFAKITTLPHKDSFSPQQQESPYLISRYVAPEAPVLAGRITEIPIPCQSAPNSPPLPPPKLS